MTSEQLIETAEEFAYAKIGNGASNCYQQQVDEMDRRFDTMSDSQFDHFALLLFLAELQHTSAARYLANVSLSHFASLRGLIAEVEEELRLPQYHLFAEDPLWA